MQGLEIYAKDTSRATMIKCMLKTIKPASAMSSFLLQQGKRSL